MPRNGGETRWLESCPVSAGVASTAASGAGLLAVRILSAGQPQLVSAMDNYLKALEKEVLGKVDKIAEIGWDAYEAAKKARST